MGHDAVELFHHDPMSPSQVLQALQERPYDGIDTLGTASASTAMENAANAREATLCAYVFVAITTTAPLGFEGG